MIGMSYHHRSKFVKNVEKLNWCSHGYVRYVKFFNVEFCNKIIVNKTIILLIMFLNQIYKFGFFSGCWYNWVYKKNFGYTYQIKCCTKCNKELIVDKFEL
jgi:hypothetical protein